MENLIEVSNLIIPFSMRALLTLREEKALAGVKTAINGGQGCVLACDLEDAWKAE